MPKHSKPVAESYAAIAGEAMHDDHVRRRLLQQPKGPKRMGDGRADSVARDGEATGDLCCLHSMLAMRVDGKQNQMKSLDAFAEDLEMVLNYFVRLDLPD